jgi:hypothetical protein
MPVRNTIPNVSISETIRVIVAIGLWGVSMLEDKGRSTHPN